MRQSVLGIVFWGMAVFLLAGFDTACLADQSSGIELPEHSMFEDNFPFGGEAPMRGFPSRDDRGVSVGQSRVIGPDEVVNDAVVMGADLTVYGTVNGDAVCIGGDLTVGPGAVVKGDLVNVGGTLTVDPTAETYQDRVNIGAGGFPFNFLEGLQGQQADRTPDREYGGRPQDRKTFRFNMTKSHEPKDLAAGLICLATDFVYILLLLFFSLLLTAFMPRQFGHIEGYLRNEFPRSILLGIASVAGIPIVLVAFIISVIGILFIPFFLLALAVSFLMGYVVFNRMAGRKLLPGRHILLQITGGLLILHSPLIIGDLFLLPDITYLSIIGYVFRAVGSVVFFCVNFIGLGAVLYSLWGKRAPAIKDGDPKAPPEDRTSTESTEKAGGEDVGEAGGAGEAGEVKDAGEVEEVEAAGEVEEVEDAGDVEEGADRKAADEGGDDMGGKEKT
jgi:hypothetical protein